MIHIEIAAVHPRMGSPELPWPARKSEQAAGWDCHAAIDEPLELWPGRLVKVPLGFALALPDGWEAQIRPRSGLAAKGIIMPNSPGTVDADYRGEVSALLLYALQKPDPNHLCRVGIEGRVLETAEGNPSLITNATIDHVIIKPWPCREPITVEPGDRICQIIIAPVPEVTWNPVPRERLSKTERGAGGFGSTGV